MFLNLPDIFTSKFGAWINSIVLVCLKKMCDQHQERIQKLDGGGWVPTNWGGHF